MPRGLTFDLRVSGTRDEPLRATTERYEEVQERMKNAKPAFTKTIEILEEGEARHFAGLRGRYVDTGAMKASLTQSKANGAIRKAHNDELIFGSSIYYAKYHRRGRKSAVLVLKPKERKRVAEHLLNFIGTGQT